MTHVKLYLKNGELLTVETNLIDSATGHLKVSELDAKVALSKTAFLIKNRSSSGILQLELSEAPEAFIIGFDEALKKVGVSVNYTSNPNQYSLLLSDKWYLLFPLNTRLELYKIDSFSFQQKIQIEFP